MKVTPLPLDTARRLAVRGQSLDAHAKRLKGKRGVAHIVAQLGYIQIDTIAVIQRTHHHTLWTRQSDYHPDMLHTLQAKDRTIFEYWGHALAYLPMQDYRYFLPRIEHFQNSQSRWITQMREKAAPVMQAVLQRIREEGPLGAKDFEAPPSRKSGSWWDWKPAKLALELMVWNGELMVTERRNFQKVYDLTERVLPANIDTRVPDNEELGHFFVRRALSAYGIAHEREMCTFMQPNAIWDSRFLAASKQAVVKALADLVEAGEVSPVHIPDVGKTRYYALADSLKKAARRKPTVPTVSLLSPFDNLIIQRDRTQCLFGFDYRLECYTPAAKRTYGYFVLPILWGDQLVGRLDPKADRKNKTLLIHSLMFEPGFVDFESFLPAFVKTLQEFARFNGCETISLKNVVPAKIQALLVKALKKQDWD